MISSIHKIKLQIIDTLGLGITTCRVPEKCLYYFLDTFRAHKKVDLFKNSLIAANVRNSTYWGVGRDYSA